MALAAARDTHVDIVMMKRRHVRSVIRIEQQVYPRPWSTSLFLSELALGPSRTYLVARVGRAVAGYAGLMVAGDDAHITTIAVDPGWHRHGIATRLLVALARDAVVRESVALTLEVRETNVGAQDLYRRFGFSAAGVRRGYYGDAHEDAVVMWARDIQSRDYRARLDSLLLGVSGTTTFEVRR